MIGKLSGTFAGITSDGTVIIDVGGVGYVVRVPLLTSEEVQTHPLVVSLFVHTAVREDAIDLYGFLTNEELSFFKQLTSVSGIGPKTALGILNAADIQSLKHSIARSDTTTLTKVFGVGKKSAERVVVELRDKLTQGEESSVDDGQVLEALLALGYRIEEVRQALKILLKAEVQPQSVSERVSATLKILGTRRAI